MSESSEPGARLDSHRGAYETDWESTGEVQAPDHAKPG